MSDYLEGTLDVDQTARVRRHLRFCPSCRRLLLNLVRTVEALRHLRPPDTPADSH